MDYDSGLPSHSCPDKRLLVVSTPEDALRSRLLSWPMGNRQGSWQMADAMGLNLQLGEATERPVEGES